MDKPKQPDNAPQPNPELDKYRDVDPIVLGTYPLSELPAILKSVWDRPPPPPPPPEPPDK